MKISKSANRLLLICVSAAGIFLFGCKKDGKDRPNAHTFKGDAQAIGNGTIYSFVTLDSSNKPQTIGLRFSETALSGLSMDTTMNMMDLVTRVPLPPEAFPIGIDHIEVNWNPFGHEPREVYGLPHFDYHFYMVSSQEQANVVPGPDTTPVPSNFIPQDYISGIVAVPDMGVHWVDAKAPELNGQKFTDTFIYGFYHGNMTFLEPMITMEYLMAKPDFKIQIKQPAAFQKTGYYPTLQHIQFDYSTQEFVVSLEGLKYFAGQPGTAR